MMHLFVFQINMDHYGIDWEGPSPHDDQEIVEVEDAVNPLEDADYTTLKQQIDPHQHDDAYGINLYIATHNFVISKVQQLG